LGKLRKLKKEIKFELEYYFENNIFRKIYRYITHGFWYKLEMAYSYAKLGWNSHDFDHVYIDEFLLFKLKRMYKCFINGYHSETCENYKPKMKSIKLVIKLLNLYLNDEERYFKFYNLHNKKWGTKTRKTIPADIDEDGYVLSYRVTFEHDKKLTEEEKIQEKKELLESFKKDERRRQRDISLIYKIIGKYNLYWWD
jgi:hypothetical protein